MKDTFNLQRFIDAQNPEFECVIKELTAGQKLGHWMWYIFPQIKGLGHSIISTKYAIASQEEAAAYLQHPILGSRLKQCTQIVNDIVGRNIEQIFPYPDHLKFHSCMTLFMVSSSDNNRFKKALIKYFRGIQDNLTLGVLMCRNEN